MGKEIAIDANMTNNCGIASATLYYRQGGEINFTPVPMSLPSNIYRGIILASAVTSRGLEYYIVGTDVAGDKTRWPSSGIISVQVIVPEPGVTKGSAQPNGSEQTAYRLISAPIDLDNKSVRAILEDDLGPYDVYKWRCYEVGASQRRSEFPNISDMTPGKAFWLIVKDEGKVIDTGTGKSNITSKEFAIALHPRWNLVANPFNFDIPVSKLRLQNNGQAPELRSYTGSWNNPITEKVTVMQPFQGYAVLNDLTSVDTLFVNPDLSSSGSPLFKQVTLTSQPTFLWSIGIQAKCQQARDGDNIAAVVNEASKEWDEMDYPEPPVVGEYVSVYFPHPEWKRASESYCTDIRPEPTNGAVWEFEVKTNIRDVVHLRFEGLESIPQEFNVWLVDEALKIPYNLRENNHYSVAGSGADNSKRLKLVVGKSDFVDEKLSAVQVIPSAYELSQNFPNPFNPVTTIRYGLPQAERVTLRIYNLFGQEVVTLVDSELKPAGYHAAIWDGRNSNGSMAASGIYFVWLRVGSFVQSRKLLLVE